MEEMTAETNVEEFDDTEVDAGLGGAEEQTTKSAGDAAEETTDEVKEQPESEAELENEPETKPEKPFVKKGNDDNRDRRIAQREKWRREREEAEAKAYQKGIIDSVGGVNPYNHQKIEDEADIHEFLLMREIENSGGDPISDFASFTKKKAREEAQKSAEEVKTQKEREWFDKDFSDFSEKHPDVDFGKLQSDKTFQIFAEGKIGNQPLNKIYDDFIAVTGKYEERAKKTAQKLLAKAKASPGSLVGGEPQTLSYGDLSDEEFEKMIQKAKRGELSKN